MDEGSIYTAYTDCELKYMGEGYNPSMAAEICANVEARRSDEETEKSNKDEDWEYWLG